MYLKFTLFEIIEHNYGVFLEHESLLRGEGCRAIFYDSMKENKK